MNKLYDIFIGRIDGWHTYRTAQAVDDKAVADWLKQGFKISTEHQIGSVLHEIYLVKI